MEVLWFKKKKNITSFFFNKSRFTTRLMLNLCVCVYCSDLLFVPTILSIFFFSSNKILLKKTVFVLIIIRVLIFILSHMMLLNLCSFFLLPLPPPPYIVIACENSAIRKTRRTTRGYTVFHGKNPRKNKWMHTPKKTNGCK